MNVKLVSLTKPHSDMGDMNCEDLIALLRESK